MNKTNTQASVEHSTPENAPSHSLHDCRRTVACLIAMCDDDRRRDNDNIQGLRNRAENIQGHVQQMRQSLGQSLVHIQVLTDSVPIGAFDCASDDPDTGIGYERIRSHNVPSETIERRLHGAWNAALVQCKTLDAEQILLHVLSYNSVEVAEIATDTDFSSNATTSVSSPLLVHKPRVNWTSVLTNWFDLLPNNITCIAILDMPHSESFGRRVLDYTYPHIPSSAAAAPSAPYPWPSYRPSEFEMDDTAKIVAFSTPTNTSDALTSLIFAQALCIDDWMNDDSSTIETIQRGDAEQGPESSDLWQQQLCKVQPSLHTNFYIASTDTISAVAEALAQHGRHASEECVSLPHVSCTSPEATPNYRTQSRHSCESDTASVQSVQSVQDDMPSNDNSTKQHELEPTLSDSELIAEAFPASLAQQAQTTMRKGDCGPSRIASSSGQGAASAQRAIPIGCSTNWTASTVPTTTACNDGVGTTRPIERGADLNAPTNQDDPDSILEFIDHASNSMMDSGVEVNYSMLPHRARKPVRRESVLASNSTVTSRNAIPWVCAKSSRASMNSEHDCKMRQPYRPYAQTGFAGVARVRHTEVTNVRRRADSSSQNRPSASFRALLRQQQKHPVIPASSTTVECAPKIHGFRIKTSKIGNRGIKSDERHDADLDIWHHYSRQDESASGVPEVICAPNDAAYDGKYDGNNLKSLQVQQISASPSSDNAHIACSRVVWQKSSDQYIHGERMQTIDFLTSIQVRESHDWTEPLTVQMKLVRKSPTEACFGSPGPESTTVVEW